MSSESTRWIISWARAHVSARAREISSAAHARTHARELSHEARRKPKKREAQRSRVRPLARLADGIVWKAVDKKSKETVALKKVFDAFQNATDAQRTYREVHFLLKMRGHPNIITLQHVMKADNDRDLYLTFEFMDTDLNAAIKANILEDVHKQYIMYQCFDALQFMHACELVHRDMKPANLLLNSMCLMKVCDFGLARSVATWNDGGDVRDAIMTDYVATRWYRAPEILVASSSYDYSVDMWSAGCILAECLLGKPAFTGVRVQAHQHASTPARKHASTQAVRAAWMEGVLSLFPLAAVDAVRHRALPCAAVHRRAPA
jgi:serine/threonine protein kinase